MVVVILFETGRMLCGLRSSVMRNGAFVVIQYLQITRNAENAGNFPVVNGARVNQGCVKDGYHEFGRWK